jgi:hypothetical protein
METTLVSPVFLCWILIIHEIYNKFHFLLLILFEIFYHLLHQANHRRRTDHFRAKACDFDEQKVEGKYYLV